MSIRKRTWTTARGDEKSAWVVDYVDTKGTRRLKTFVKKKEADSFAATAKVEVREGLHVADSDSVTVSAASAFWIATGEDEGLERSSIDQRKRHIDCTSSPSSGRRCCLNSPCRAFANSRTSSARTGDLRP